VFHKSKWKYILQVMFRRTLWTRSWSILSREEDGCILKEGSGWLETMALEFFNKSGRNVLRRIKNYSVSAIRWQGAVFLYLCVRRECSLFWACKI
jgi:hypothetical protein